MFHALRVDYGARNHPTPQTIGRILKYFEQFDCRYCFARSTASISTVSDRVKARV